MVQKISESKQFFLFKIGLLLLISLITTSEQLFAERFSIIADKANIRSGPGAEYDILWQVEKHYPILVIQKRGSWYLFSDFEDDKGWVHKSLLGKTKTVITLRDGKNNVRKEPSMKSEKAFFVEKGVPFKVIKNKGRWLYIKHSDGDMGWIYDSLVW